MAGTQDLVVAGGVQNMSMIPICSAMTVTEPHGLHRIPSPAPTGWLERYGDQEISQFRGADMIAEKWDITREDMEAFAIESPRAGAPGHTPRAASSARSCPSTASTHDEGPREPNSRRSRSLNTLVEGGRVTAAVASQISDAVGRDARRVRAGGEGPRPDAPGPHPPHVGASATTRSTCSPAPIPATRRALEKAGMTVDDIDLVEINEAFASVVLAWLKDTDVDPHEKVNVNGGAIALGHPLGATGVRLMTTLLNELERTGGRYGLQTMCEGGGQANVTIIERL